jgi:hypothetical protein
MKKALTFASLICALLLPAVAAAQTSNQPRGWPRIDSSNNDGRPLSEIEEEIKAKQAIKYAEKEHQENLDRAKEIAQLGKELKAAAKDTPLVSRDSYKKIERLEKLTRKVRDEAGGEDEEVKLDKRPSNVPSALTQIGETAESLSKDVQNTPRHVVSASVIGNANVLLELIKIARTLTSKP